MAIEGQVARILSEEALVLNRGSSHGVKEGTRFVIYTELDDVADPETGSSLGKLELVKARVVAAHVQESMTTCAPEPTVLAGSEEDSLHQTLSSEMVAVSMLGRRAEPGKLSVQRSEAAGVPRPGPVKVGDRARSVD